MAVARPHGERAARLQGAAEALRDFTARMPSIERPGYDAEVGRLRAVLDGSSLRSAWAEGRETTADEAIAFALAD